MPIFAFYADEHRKKRPDGANFILASGTTETEARSAGEDLINAPGALAEFVAIELDDLTPPAVAQGEGPVGSNDQAIWPTLTRGGNRL
ncbi:MAG: hypothetical protein AAGI12_14065 [Pseudomonadota bacterium]